MGTSQARDKRNGAADGEREGVSLSLGRWERANLAQPFIPRRCRPTTRLRLGHSLEALVGQNPDRGLHPRFPSLAVFSASSLPGSTMSLSWRHWHIDGGSAVPPLIPFCFRSTDFILRPYEEVWGVGGWNGEAPHNE